MYTSVSGWILIVCASLITLAAAAIDYRTQRIPNYLTLPAFALGWVYQLYMQFYSQTPGAGLLDGLKGFAIGFGMYFVLWLVGSGGGGDAKLAGAVSVWLGFHKTLGMILVSTVFVIVGTGFVMLWGMLTRGVYRTKEDLLPSQEAGKKPKKRLELLRINRGRKGMTFALSLALATVAVTLFAVPEWPYRKVLAEQRAARAAAQQQRKAQKKSTPPQGGENKTTERPHTNFKRL